MAKKLDLSELFGKQVKQDERVYSRTIAQFHEFYLTGEIQSPEEYIEWFQTIRHASSSDVIKIYINSPGGDGFTAIQMIRALQETSATIIMSVEGMCASAATMILMQGDSFEVSDHSVLMVHNYSSGMMGKGGELYDQIKHERKWSENMLKEVYKDFLTEKEITSVLNNKDIWLDGDDVIKRLKKMAKQRNKQSQEMSNDNDE